MIESLRPATWWEKFEIRVRRALGMGGPPCDAASRDAWSPWVTGGREVAIYASDEVLDKLYGVSAPDMVMMTRSAIPLADPRDCSV